MTNRFKYRNKIYSIINCTNNDIPSHIEKVYQYWNSDEIDIQRERMKEAVYNGTAYKLIDEDNNTLVFAYYDYKAEQVVNGIALWWYNIRMFAIFGVWFRAKTYIQYIHITPHNKQSVVAFQFIVEDSSIKSWYYNKTSLVIDLYSEKSKVIEKLYEKMEVEEL